MRGSGEPSHSKQPARQGRLVGVAGPGDDGVWDLAVVGAGPAGAAAALSALRVRPRARVLLLDRSDFPRDKSCGDGVAPHGLDELARLGVAGVLADRVPIHRLRLRAPGGQEVLTVLARPDVVVPRTVLDARLVGEAVAAGAVLRRHRVRHLESRPDRVVLDGEVHARVVVGADGANGVVRRQLALPAQPDSCLAVAVRGYAAAPPGEPEQVIVMAEAGWPAYAWSFAAGDGTANVGFGMLLPRLREAGLSSSGRQELYGRLAELLLGVTASRLLTHHLPLSTARPRQPAGRVLLAGDAASLINPLTGEGIYYALLSGRLAGAAAVGGSAEPGAARRGDPGRYYAADLRRELGRHLRHTTALTRLAGRPGVVDAGVAAAGRSATVAAALVEVGLGRGLVTAPLLAGIAGQLGRRLVRHPTHR